MNVSLEKNDNVKAVITINLVKADYAQKAEESLKDFRKKASLPGFRPGQVPMGLLKKRFGRDFTAEAVEKVVREELDKYIKDNNVEVLGEAIPSAEQNGEFDFENQEEFTFKFDVALKPEFDLTLDANDTIDYYDIEVSDKMVDGQVKMYAQRAGSYSKVDSYEDGDMVKGLLAELDADGNTKEGGIQVEGAVMLPRYMKDDAQKALFDGCKVNDVLVFNPAKAYEGSNVELSSLLKIEKEAAAEVTADFSFQVEEVTRFVEGELNQELFDNVFPGAGITDEAGFRARIAEVMAAQFGRDSDFKFIEDLRTYVFNKIGEVPFAEDVLKRYIKMVKLSRKEEYKDEDYAQQTEALKWQLAKDKLAKANNLKVEQEDLKNTAKNLAKIQFAQYGMLDVPDNVLDNYADKMLKEHLESMIDRCIEEKIAAALKSVVTLNHKPISVEDFNKMYA